MNFVTTSRIKKIRKIVNGAVLPEIQVQEELGNFVGFLFIRKTEYPKTNDTQRENFR